MWYLYRMEYLTIKKNKPMLCAGKWIEQKTTMLNKRSQVQKLKGHMFPFMCDI
jgi:hypothetical protein